MFITSRGYVRHTVPGILVVLFSAATLAAAPQLRLSTTAIGPVYVELGASAPAQLINAYNIGDGSLNLTITSSASWLSGSVGAPTNCAQNPTQSCIPISIAINSTGLALGTYTESLTVTDPNAIDSPQSITVTVQINGAPSSIDLYVTPAGGPSPTASVSVNTGGQVQSSVKTADNGQWLSFTLAGGGSYQFYTPYQLQVSAQSGQSGNYSGTVTLSGSPLAPDNKTINVNLHVTSQPIVQASQLTYNLIQGQAAQTFNVNIQNLGVGSLSISGVSTSGGSWLSAIPARDNPFAAPGSVVAVTLDPRSLNPGSYTGSLTLASNAANASVPIPVRLNISPAGNPVTNVGGVVDNAAFSANVASGTIAAVFGSQFSTSGPVYASSVPLPTSLGGVQVLVNGTPAPLIYVNGFQADFQVPFGMTAGQMTVQLVRNGQGGNQISAAVDSVAPRLFPYRDVPAAPDSLPYGLIYNASDGTLALPSNLGVPAHPAKRGDVVTIWALGLGPVDQPVATGAAAPASEPLARTVNPVQVYFGGGFIGFSQATPSYAGLAPNLVGEYQVNVTIPMDAPLGNVPVTLSMPGHVSNYVEMAIAPASTSGQ